VHPSWLLDSILAEELLPMSQYIVAAVASDSEQVLPQGISGSAAISASSALEAPADTTWAATTFRVSRAALQMQDSLLCTSACAAVVSTKAPILQSVTAVRTAAYSDDETDPVRYVQTDSNSASRPMDFPCATAGTGSSKAVTPRPSSVQNKGSVLQHPHRLDAQSSKAHLPVFLLSGCEKAHRGRFREGQCSNKSIIHRGRSSTSPFVPLQS